MSKRILVTGGAGFLGSNLCKRLVAEGHSVVSLDNGSRGARKVEGVEYIDGDVTDPHDVDLAVAGFDNEPVEAVFHLAAINGTKHFYERPEEVLNVQIEGTLNVLRACRNHSIKELVLFSSSEVYGQADQIPTPETVPLKIADPFNPRFSYAAGKIAAEMMCLHARHLDRVLVIRPHNVYGPDMGFEHVIPELTMQAARRDGKYVVVKGHGNETRAFCHISDFIDGVMVAWDSGVARLADIPRAVYHVGSEDEREIADVARLICGAPLKIIKSAKPSGPRRRCPSITKLRALGWPGPRITLEDGLRETVDWYLANRERWPK